MSVDFVVCYRNLYILGKFSRRFGWELGSVVSALRYEQTVTSSILSGRAAFTCTVHLPAQTWQSVSPDTLYYALYCANDKPSSDESNVTKLQ